MPLVVKHASADLKHKQQAPYHCSLHSYIRLSVQDTQLCSHCYNDTHYRQHSHVFNVSYKTVCSVIRLVSNFLEVRI